MCWQRQREKWIAKEASSHYCRDERKKLVSIRANGKTQAMRSSRKFQGDEDWKFEVRRYAGRTLVMMKVERVSKLDAESQSLMMMMMMMMQTMEI